MTPEKGIFSIIDSYLDKLDRASISSEGMFKTKNDKEKYETLLMYAFRKYMAAKYHYRNVKTFIKEEASKWKLSLRDQDKPSGLKSTLGVRRSKHMMSGDANHYAYELSAFLEALKSSIDFLATACILHLQSVKGDSISTLIKITKKKNKTGSIIDVVKRNIDWLTSLRTYRHHIIHRLMIRTSSGYEKREIEGISRTVTFPVIIPESLPAYIPDTRKTRSMDMMRDMSDLYDASESKMRINGRLVEYSFNYHPPRGYVSVDSFMESHLNSYEKFSNELINQLSDLDFRVIAT